MSIVKLGHPALRKICKPVTSHTSSELAEISNQLLSTVCAKKGWGLAAPQLGFDTRAIVMATPDPAFVRQSHSRPSRKRPSAKLTKPVYHTEHRVQINEFANIHYTVMLNPVLKKTIDKYGAAASYESCLSVPDTIGLVSRADAIQVSYEVLRQGRKHAINQVLFGHAARVFQHELDHLNGIMFLDRIQDPKLLCSESQVAEHIEWLASLSDDEYPELVAHVQSCVGQMNEEVEGGGMREKTEQYFL